MARRRNSSRCATDARCAGPSCATAWRKPFAVDSGTIPPRGPAFDLHRLARLTAHRRIATLCDAHGVAVDWALFDGTDFLALRPAELDLIALYVSHFRTPMRIDPANAPDALEVRDLTLRTKFHIAQGLGLDGRPT